MDIVKWLHDEARCGFSNSKKLKEAADEIERLQEEHHNVRILNEQYYNENAILTDEIERLREALKVIANSSEEWGAFAQEALQQKDSE